MMIRDEIQMRVIDIVRDVFGLDPISICTAEMCLKDLSDAGVDPIDYLDLKFRLEQEFKHEGFKVGDEDSIREQILSAKADVTVQSVVDFVERKLAEAVPA